MPEQADPSAALSARMDPSFAQRLTCEAIGTFILVFGGTGSAVLAATFPGTGIGFLGVALAFGFSVLVAIYAFGPISGAHFNPAVTIGLCVGGRFPWKMMPPYIAAQLVGGIAASGVVLAIAVQAPLGYDLTAGGLAANGYGEHSPGGYGLGAALISEIVLTFIFVSVIFGATSGRSIPGFAGIPIGLTLALVHLVGIPVTNVSVNPARSTAPALFVGDWALQQLWLFWVAPLVGGALAGLVGVWLHREKRARVAEEPSQRPAAAEHPAPA
jgi:aquaporin Z